MKRIFLFVASLMLMLYVGAQEPTVVINMWPNGAPTSNGLTGPERVMDMHVSNVTQPTLTIWAAPNPNGLAVIACPGGGYTDVWNGSEGNNMAQWYMDQGITLAVLKYRLPNGHYEVPLDDVHAPALPMTRWVSRCLRA